MSNRRIGKYFPLILISTFIYPIDNPHFYRANYFWGEPRFEKPWLTSFDMSFGAGSTDCGRNKWCKKTNILNIYGPQNIQALGIGIPLDPANPFDQILINLQNLPARDGFAHLRFTGEFSDIELTCNLYQNLINGFFLQAYIPFRRLKLSNIRYHDLSPLTGFPNANTPEWLAAWRNFNQILNRFDISLQGVNQFGPGDLSILVGWARNYEDTEDFDFIDVDAKIGVLFPTGRKQNIHQPFDLPLGYNGHWAIPLKFDFALGMFEWLNWGCHIGGLFFFKKDKNVSIKTAREQSGFIKLGITKAEVDPGTIWEFSTYFKADHVLRGLSLLIGYTFTERDRTFIECDNQTFCNRAVANTDALLKNWHMHVMHFMIEYDFTQKPTGAGWRAGFFYNRIVSGKRIFDANIKAVSCGLDIAWCY